MKVEYNVIIIGAGVSGMTAALYLKRAGISCCILEKSAPGGQINYTSTIENYPGNPNILGPDLAYQIYEQVNALEVPFVFEEVLEIKEQEEKKQVITKNHTLSAKYIIIATGRSPRKLQVPKEEELLGKGVSYCAICDGALYKNQEVVVIGGGDSAIKESLYLSNICKKVTMIHRRSSFRSKEDITSLKEKRNIEIMYKEEVKEFVGEDRLKKVILKSNKEITCAACFIFIGYHPETEILKSLQIPNKEGYIKTNKYCETKIKNIYAVGDVRKKGVFQIITAMNDGVEVALKIIEELN